MRIIPSGHEMARRMKWLENTRIQIKPGKDKQQPRMGRNVIQQGPMQRTNTISYRICLQCSIKHYIRYTYITLYTVDALKSMVAGGFCERFVSSVG